MRRILCLMLVALVLLLILPIQPAEALPVMDNHKQELAENVAKQIVAGMPSWVDTDEEKVLYLHNHLVETVTYEHNDNDQTAYGALVLQRCVCAGYARGLALLLNTAGIEADTISAWPSDGGVGHEWTYFYLNGIKLYADATWSDYDFTWKGIQGQPAKYVYYSAIMTEKQEREAHAKYLFDDGVYDGSGSDAGTEYNCAGILERNGVPVGHFNRETTPEEALPYFKVVHYEDGNALIRIAYYYESAGDFDYMHNFAANRAAELFLDSVEESYVSAGAQCEAYYWGPLANFTPVPAQGLVLRTTKERETRVGEPFIVTAEVYPYEASNKRVVYTSSDPSIATVDQYGTVIGSREGKVLITATSVDGGYTDSVEVTITSDHYHDSWLENIFEKAPTCEEPGCKMYFRCQSCGAWFPDYWGSAEIKDHDSWKIPALGHQESGWMYDATGHWKQCTRDGCGKMTQEKAAHNDGDGNGACDTCGYRAAVVTPTQPTTVPPATVTPTTTPATTPTTVPTTVPPETTVATRPTTAPVQPTDPTVSPPAPTTGTEAVPNTTPGAQVPTPGQSRQWILWATLGLVVLIPMGVVLLRKRKV